MKQKIRELLEEKKSDLSHHYRVQKERTIPLHIQFWNGVMYEIEQTIIELENILNEG